MMSQSSSMRNLAATDRAYLIGRNRHHRSRPSGEGYELDLVSLMPRINVNHRSNVPGFKAFFVERRGQNYPVMLANHGCNYTKADGL